MAIKFSHFAYRPNKCIDGGFVYDIPVYKRVRRHVVVPA